MDFPLLPTVDEILSDVSKFRILVVGKSGCGKSALLSKVFGIDASPENGDVVEKLEGDVPPNIQGGITFRENPRFVLYTSPRDFFPNSDADFDDIRDFIHAHLNAENQQKILHAIWVCIDAPLGGERLNENGMERILEVAHKKVPIIVVLTKFDMLVDSVASTEKASDLVCEDEAREKAEHYLDDTLKKVSFDSLLCLQLMTPVSTLAGYEDTISSLVQSTDGAIRRLQGRRTHDSPVALEWAIAQRQDLDTTVAAIIDVGGKRYWKGLGSTTDFKGRTLEQCVSIIHEDIISIWNVRDSSNYLGREDFKARMSHLVEDPTLSNHNETTILSSPGLTTFAAATSNPISAIGAAAEAAKWVSDVYQATPSNIACVMGYIVDLIMVLVFLSEIHQFPESDLHWHPIEEDAVNAIKAYISSRLLFETHKNIRKFVAAEDKHCGVAADGREDVVLHEIVRLVKKFCSLARDAVKNTSEKVSSRTVSVISDESLEQLVKGESVKSNPRISSVKPTRSPPRRSAQDHLSPDILTIVEEATKIINPWTSTSPDSAQHPTLLVPELSSAESSIHTPLSALNPLNWIRRDHSAGDEEAGKGKT